MFFVGVLAILIAIVLFGLSILGLAATVTGPDANSAPWLGTHVFCMRRRAPRRGAGLSPLRPRNRPLEPAEPVSRRPLRLVHAVQAIRAESGPGQIWTGDLPVISRTLQPG